MWLREWVINDFKHLRDLLTSDTSPSLFHLSLRLMATCSSSSWLLRSVSTWSSSIICPQSFRFPYPVPMERRTWHWHSRTLSHSSRRLSRYGDLSLTSEKNWKVLLMINKNYNFSLVLCGNSRISILMSWHAYSLWTIKFCMIVQYM